MVEIIIKYYNKNGNLRVLKENNNTHNSIIRFKLLKDKEFPCCDFKGKCSNFAYAEVYPKKGWSYLCKKHYFEEQRRLKWKLPTSLKVEW